MLKKKILIVLISFIWLMIFGIAIYIFFIKKEDSYLHNKQLRYYKWEKEKYVEYKYTCKNDKCKSKEIEDDLYLLDDNDKYLYKPTENEKIKVCCGCFDVPVRWLRRKEGRRS